MSLSMSGNPRGTVESLVQHGTATCNAKLIETAYLVLQRYGDKIADAQDLTRQVADLRARYCSSSGQPTLGGQKRQAGGLTLRTGAKPAPAKAAA